MRPQAYQTHRAYTRRDQRGTTCRWHVGAVASRSGVVAMQGTLLTAKINPSGAPGGYPNKGEP